MKTGNTRFMTPSIKPHNTHPDKESRGEGHDLRRNHVPLKSS